VLLAALLLAACSPDDEGVPAEGEELGIGEIDDLKADGAWGAALTCKAVPDLPALASPEIVVSLDGLTLHLVDKAAGFDKVFPIGPGAIKNDASLTPVSTAKAGGTFFLRLDKPTGADSTDPRKQPWYYANSCKFWWHDPDTGKDVPVFAGLPFLRLEGAPSLGYAIHGPIDSYTLPSGGKLKRGYVSHGCIRMEAADVLEVFARCKGRKVPVRVQRAVERRADGTAVDLDQRWLLSECASGAECNYQGGACRYNEYAGRGFCTASCTKYCSYDKWGYPESFCVADPGDDQKGICILKGSSVNNWCRRYPGQALAPGEPRFNDPKTKADACLPGSSGWIGSPCFTDLDCTLSGGPCELDGAAENRPGFCTRTCTSTCPDKPGYAGTFCIDGGGKGECAAKCFSQDDCGSGYSCTPGTPRYKQPSVTASVCL
jgi:hypothetical protein